MLQYHRASAIFSRMTLGGILIAGSLSLAPTAHADPGDLDDIYGVQRQRCERQPSLPACINFSILASPPTMTNPSTRAIPTRLKHHRNRSVK
jgi:hypothetical protein